MTCFHFLFKLLKKIKISQQLSFDILHTVIPNITSLQEKSILYLHILAPGPNGYQINLMAGWKHKFQLWMFLHCFVPFPLSLPSNPNVGGLFPNGNRWGWLGVWKLVLSYWLKIVSKLTFWYWYTALTFRSI